MAEPKYKVGDEFVIEIGEVMKSVDGDNYLYRLKGFNAATWDDNGLDKLRHLGNNIPTFLPYKSYRELLNMNPDDMSEDEKKRYKRIIKIPETTRLEIEEERKELRKQVMELEAKSDYLNDFLDGDLDYEDVHDLH